MSIKSILLATSLLLGVIAIAQPAQAWVPNTPCASTQSHDHRYTIFFGAFATIDGGAMGGSNTFVADVDGAQLHCDGYDTTGDGDAETGVNGGRFPGNAACLGTVGTTFPGDNPWFFYPLTGDATIDGYITTYGGDPYLQLLDSYWLPAWGNVPQYAIGHPAVAHHTITDGTPVDVVDDLTPTGIQGTIGTDGPAAAAANYQTTQNGVNGQGKFESGDPLNDCTGNGVISNDDTTDPGDCGAGDIGIAKSAISVSPLVTGPLGASTVASGVPMTIGANIHKDDAYALDTIDGIADSASVCEASADGMAWAFLPFGPVITTGARGDGGYLFTAEGDGGDHQYCGTTQDVTDSLGQGDDGDTNTDYNEGGPLYDPTDTDTTTPLGELSTDQYTTGGSEGNGCIRQWLGDNQPHNPSVFLSLPIRGNFNGY